MRDYDATVKNLREAAKGLLFDAMPYRASVMKDAADAIEELLEWKRLLESKNNLQAKIIKHMETVMKVNGLPTPPKEETE